MFGVSRQRLTREELDAHRAASEASARERERAKVEREAEEVRRKLEASAAFEASTQGQLYAARNRLAILVARLPLRDLRRLLELLEAATPDDLRRTAGYLEGLVEWPDPDARSG